MVFGPAEVIQRNRSQIRWGITLRISSHSKKIQLPEPFRVMSGIKFWLVLQNWEQRRKNPRKIFQY